MIDELVVLRRRGLGLTNSTRFLEDWRQQMASGHCDRTCDAGKLSLDVLPDGGVCACKEKRPIDNILDPDFVLRFRSGQFSRPGGGDDSVVLCVVLTVNIASRTMRCTISPPSWSGFVTGFCSIAKASTDIAAGMTEIVG